MTGTGVPVSHGNLRDSSANRSGSVFQVIVHAIIFGHRSGPKALDPAVSHNEAGLVQGLWNADGSVLPPFGYNTSTVLSRCISCGAAEFLPTLRKVRKVRSHGYGLAKAVADAHIANPAESERNRS